MTVHAVAVAWARGRTARAANLRTDGKTVWSWGLVIGRTVDGIKVAVDHRGTQSGSTTRHCNLVCAVADSTKAPS